jgi:flagellar hook-length control protein FliK
MVPFQITPEENTMEVEITPAFLPDMHSNFVMEAPVEQIQAETQEALTEAPKDFVREVVRQVQTEVVDFSTQPVIQQQAEETEETVIVENVEVETPVFGYMEAEPVKVSATVETPVELEAPDGMEQLRGRIEQFLTDAEGNSYVELTLSPPELGKITVALTEMNDGTLHIQLSASTVRAAELLERNTSGLQQLLASTSRPEVKVEMRDTEPQPYIFINPNEDNGQEQRNRQQGNQKRDRDNRHGHEDRDFIQQLRLGLVGID